MKCDLAKKQFEQINGFENRFQICMLHFVYEAQQFSFKQSARMRHHFDE